MLGVVVHDRKGPRILAARKLVRDEKRGDPFPEIAGLGVVHTEVKKRSKPHLPPLGEAGLMSFSFYTKESDAGRGASSNVAS